MTRKGAKQHGWTTADEQFLLKYAGVLTRREICRELKRSTESVRNKAKRYGISLRCFVSKLTWCNNCATWRTTVSERTGYCRVCAKREMLARSEQRVSDALAPLSFNQRTVGVAGSNPVAPTIESPGQKLVCFWLFCFAPSFDFFSGISLVIRGIMSCLFSFPF